MGPGFKYHVVTISAIFIALTVGLVVGSVFVSPRFARRQESAIEHLQKTLNNDVAEKTTAIKQYQECVAALSPLALHGKFNNVPVALIQTGDYVDAANRAGDALNMAGANVVAHAQAPALAMSNVELIEALSRAHTQDPRIPTSRNGLADLLAATFAQGDISSPPLLPILQREGLIEMEPDDSVPSPVHYVVLLCGSRSPDTTRIEREDGPLIRALQKHGITVVACEPTGAQVSDIASYHALEIHLATVDNIDTDIGSCALVFALSGDKDDYGVKPTAAHLLPANMAQDKSNSR